jgi:hypothetical protein
MLYGAHHKVVGAKPEEKYMSDFQTVEQIQAIIASQAAQIDRMRKAIADHIEAHDWSAVDAINRGYPDVDDLRAALQPKEGEQ